MCKQGSTLAGVMDAFSIAISIGLQYGVPLETYVAKFTNMRFEPAGMTDDPDIRIAAVGDGLHLPPPGAGLPARTSSGPSSASSPPRSGPRRSPGRRHVGLDRRGRRGGRGRPARSCAAPRRSRPPRWPSRSPRRAEVGQGGALLDRAAGAASPARPPTRRSASPAARRCAPPAAATSARAAAPPAAAADPQLSPNDRRPGPALAGPGRRVVGELSGSSGGQRVPLTRGPATAGDEQGHRWITANCLLSQMRGADVPMWSSCCASRHRSVRSARAGVGCCTRSVTAPIAVH